MFSALIDSSSAGNFLNWLTAQKMDSPLSKFNTFIPLHTVDGEWLLHPITIPGHWKMVWVLYSQLYTQTTYDPEGQAKVIILPNMMNIEKCLARQKLADYFLTSHMNLLSGTLPSQGRIYPWTKGNGGVYSGRFGTGVYYSVHFSSFSWLFLCWKKMRRPLPLHRLSMTTK